MGKRIFAVVAGVGLAAGSMVAMTPAANADDHYVQEMRWDVEAVGLVDGEYQNFEYGSPSAWAPAPNDAGKAEMMELRDECAAVGAPNNYYEFCMVLSESRDVSPDSPGDDSGDFAKDAVEPAPVPPPCWSNFNCPVGGAIQVAVPEYMIAGVPQALTVYASWRPDENTPGAPTNGDAVISIDGDPAAAAPFVDGVATLRFTPMAPGMKKATISAVANSNTSGANAWIDSVEVSTMVLEWDPEALEEALKNKKVEVGDTYTLEEIAQAKTSLGKRLKWRVDQDSKDVCAVTTTKKGEVRAKFTESGKCSIIWTDPKKDEEGKYTFIAKK